MSFGPLHFLLTTDNNKVKDLLFFKETKHHVDCMQELTGTRGVQKL
jgi:hypothetical protein